jgi:hypothetical protein
MDVEGIGWENIDWIHLAQGPMAGSCEHRNEPSRSTGGEFLQ